MWTEASEFADSKAPIGTSPPSETIAETTDASTSTTAADATSTIEEATAIVTLAETSTTQPTSTTTPPAEIVAEKSTTSTIAETSPILDLIRTEGSATTTTNAEEKTTAETTSTTTKPNAATAAAAAAETWLTDDQDANCAGQIVEPAGCRGADCEYEVTWTINEQRTDLVRALSGRRQQRGDGVRLNTYLHTFLARPS